MYCAVLLVRTAQDAHALTLARERVAQSSDAPTAAAAAATGQSTAANRDARLNAAVYFDPTGARGGAAAVVRNNRLIYVHTYRSLARATLGPCGEALVGVVMVTGCMGVAAACFIALGTPVTDRAAVHV